MYNGVKKIGNVKCSFKLKIWPICSIFKKLFLDDPKFGFKMANNWFFLLKKKMLNDLLHMLCLGKITKINSNM